MVGCIVRLYGVGYKTAVVSNDLFSVHYAMNYPTLLYRLGKHFLLI